MNWVDEGNKLYSEGEFGKSLDCYQKTIESDPSNTDALYNKALIHIMQGEYKESLDTSSRLIEIDRTNPEAWKLKGFALFYMQNYKEAVEAYNEAINLNPNDAYAWNNKGSALCHLGFFEKAIKSFENAFSLNSRYLNALKNKEKVLYFIEQIGSTEKVSNNHELLSKKRSRLLKLRGDNINIDLNELDSYPEMICPMDSCHYRAKFRTMGEICPEHGVKLIIADS